MFKDTMFYDAAMSCNIFFALYACSQVELSRPGDLIYAFGN
jgi:hypothetical protein